MKIGSWIQNRCAPVRGLPREGARRSVVARVAMLLVLIVSLPLVPAMASGHDLSSGRALPTGPTHAETARTDECITCGKRIYFGERCATCIVKSKLPDNACVDCDKRLLVGERCAMCLLRHVDAGLQHECLDCQATIRVGKRCTSCAAKHLRTQFGQTQARLLELSADLEAGMGARLGAALERMAITSDDVASDEGTPGEVVPTTRTDAQPDSDHATNAATRAAEQTEARAIQAAETSWRERALAYGQAQKARAAAGLAAGAHGFGALAERLDLGGRSVVALGAALEVADSIESTKAQLAEAGIERALAISVASDLGETTLGDLAKIQLLRALPELEGTALVDDPAAVLAAILVMDPLGFTMDLELVPTETGPVSIMEALATRGEEDPTMTFAAITLLESIADLKRGQNVTRAMRDISRALDVLVPSESQPAPQTPLDK